LAVVGLIDAVVRHESGLSGDEPFYERMATHPSGPHNFPYAYRVAIPWLVHVLPWSHVASFTLLALVAIAAGAAALYALLGEFDIDSRLRVGLTVGFALSPVLFAALVRHGRDIDPASILVLLLGTLFIVRRRRLALAVTILVGVPIRESSMFLIPLAYAVWARKPLDRTALTDVVAVGALPTVAYVALRTSINAVGRQYIPGYTGPFFTERLDIVRQALRAGTAGVELRRLAYTFGPLWLVAPFAVVGLSFARRGLVLVALCLVSLTYAFDWGRVMFLAAPVIYVAAAYVLRDRRRLSIAVVVALFALDVGYGAYLQVYGTQHGLDSSIHSHIPVF
jgi:hypothetical protein